MSVITSALGFTSISGKPTLKIFMAMPLEPRLSSKLLGASFSFERLGTPCGRGFRMDGLCK